MTLLRVAKTSEFGELEPILVNVNENTTIGVYKWKDNYYAYLDRCPHEGGPACEGITIGQFEGEVSADGSYRVFMNENKRNLVCPWHGVEFDLETGVSRSDPRDRLRPFVVSVKGDEVFVDR